MEPNSTPTHLDGAVLICNFNPFLNSFHLQPNNAHYHSGAAVVLVAPREIAGNCRTLGLSLFISFDFDHRRHSSGPPRPTSFPALRRRTFTDKWAVDTAGQTDTSTVCTVATITESN